MPCSKRTAPLSPPLRGRPSPRTPPRSSGRAVGGLALAVILSLALDAQVHVMAQLSPGATALMFRAMGDLAKCRQATGATEAEVRNMFQSRQVPTSRSGKCLLACMAEAYGVTQGGRFYPDAAMRVVDQVSQVARPSSSAPNGQPDRRRERVQQIVYTCSNEVGDRGDACETVAALANCGLQHAPSRRG